MSSLQCSVSELTVTLIRKVCIRLRAVRIVFHYNYVTHNSYSIVIEADGNGLGLFVVIIGPIVEQSVLIIPACHVAHNEPVIADKQTPGTNLLVRVTFFNCCPVLRGSFRHVHFCPQGIVWE